MNRQLRRPVAPNWGDTLVVTTTRIDWPNVMDCSDNAYL